MSDQERVLARILFQNKILNSDGNSFEDLFTQIMNYAEPDFQQIKPWGNIGDRKNDGFIRSKGIYYQVFAPENIKNSYYETVSKLEKDFNGLLNHKDWSPINEFYFLVNDKYHGVHPDACNVIDKIVKDNNLNKGKIITVKDLENKLFGLGDEYIIRVVGFLPDVNHINQIDFSVLNQVVGHIMTLSVNPVHEKIKFPDWDEKIVFNDLCNETKGFLEVASYNLGSLNDYLANEDFLAEKLQKHLISIYEDKRVDFKGDNLFWEILNECLPRREQQFFTPVVTILAKYFESCDIFEEPII